MVLRGGLAAADSPAAGIARRDPRPRGSAGSRAPGATGNFLPRRRRRHAAVLGPRRRGGRAAACGRRHEAEDPGSRRLRGARGVDAGRSRGAGFLPGSEILLAAGAQEFAEAVARLLADPTARRSQAAAARARVEGQYDWRSIGRGFARGFPACLHDRGRRGARDPLAPPGCWSYLLYPAVIEQLSRRAPEASPRGGEPGSLEVILSAADEEDVMWPRRESSRAGGGGASLHLDRMRRLPGSNGEVGRRRPRWMRASRGVSGKAREGGRPERFRRGLAADVLVFTDANTRFEPGAVRRLAEAFDDPAVGAVCGRLVLESAASGRTSETAFWAWETGIKEAEGRLGVCLGANGAIYAARRAWIEPLPAGTILDDFLIPARIAAKGKESRLRRRRRGPRGGGAGRGRPGGAALPDRGGSRTDPQTGSLALRPAPRRPALLRFLLAKGRALVRSGPRARLRSCRPWATPDCVLSERPFLAGPPCSCCPSARARACRVSPAGSMISA